VVTPVSGGDSAARAAALEALLHVDRGIRDELHAFFDRAVLSRRDRALATQLAAGAVRHRRTLRLILQHVRGRDAREAQTPLREILELGAFQLLFLDRVPPYAAIHEAVEAARRWAAGKGGAKAPGFVNGMLRGVQRLVAGRDPAGRPAPDALPHPEGGVVRLRAAVLPDPQSDRAAFLGAAYSYPDWLVVRWLEVFGDAAEDVCRWGNRRPRLFARIHPQKSSDPFFAEVAPGPRPGCVDVTAVPMERLEALLADGTLTIQDPAAMAAVEALAPAPGETVLDLCASPGTKTTQIVEALGGQGRVVACDRSEEKLEPIRRTVASRGLVNVTVCPADEAESAAPTGGFDAALVDAPCSNTGVLARRPEVRWRIQPSDLDELAAIQGGLLARAAGLVRPGGRMVYSTCSLEAEENDGVVSGFLKSNAAWHLVRRDFLLPAADHDGAFWAWLAKR